MDQGGEEFILRCGQCNKPFDKQSTLKRHGYYCRSRRTGTQTTRARACLSCAKTKARCDHKRPKCSRCMTRSINCHYPANSPKSAGLLQAQKDQDVSTERTNTSPSPIQGDSPDVEIPQDTSLSDQSLTTFGGDYSDWHDPFLNFPGSINRQTANEIFQLQDMSPFNMSIPVLRVPNPRAFVRRTNEAKQRISSLIFHTLKSYPRMMLRQKVPPPFIHSHLLSSNDESDDAEPLHNCMSLVHMVNGGIPGSQKLFWRNVRQECEYFCAEYPAWNKWKLLASLQALAIYIIIRMDQGETDHNNLDSLLLTTVTVISIQFNDITSYHGHAPGNCGTETNWNDWIFAESTRRTCIIYQVINMLVYFEPAALCDMEAGLVLAPLPSNEELWEAEDELVWRAETARQPGTSANFGLASNGELVKLDARQLNPKAPNWDEWGSAMDRIGGLVMLAASLIE